MVRDDGERIRRREERAEKGQRKPGGHGASGATKGKRHGKGEWKRRESKIRQGEKKDEDERPRMERDRRTMGVRERSVGTREGGGEVEEQKKKVRAMRAGSHAQQHWDTREQDQNHAAANGMLEVKWEEDR